MQFDHAGIATTDATELADLYGELLDAPVVHEEEFDGMGVTFLDLDDGYFELLEPHEENVVSEYLDERGAGVHHLGVRTDDVEAALERAREAGVELVDEEPTPGAWGSEVAFLHPRSTGGVLVEFVSR